MGSNKINLAIRFLLELTALIVTGIWGWQQYDGFLQYIAAFGIPIAMATVWGIFAVPNDPSRSGKALIVVPGLIRLVLELTVFAISIWALFDMGYTTFASIMVFIVAIHYIISYDRIIWLSKH